MNEKVITLALGFLGAIAGNAVFDSTAPQDDGADEHSLVLDELVVKRIRVVDDDGANVVVLANRDRFPLPRLGGKEYPRSIDPAGMVFYRKNGDECGGVAVVDTPEATANMMILDFAKNDAIGFGVRETKNSAYAGLTISDRAPLDSDPMESASLVHQRVILSNAGGRAGLALNDAGGQSRIELSVDAAGNPRFLMLDRDGEVVLELP